jgi:hypothetical protein
VRWERKGVKIIAAICWARCEINKMRGEFILFFYFNAKEKIFLIFILSRFSCYIIFIVEIFGCPFFLDFNDSRYKNVGEDDDFLKENIGSLSIKVICCSIFFASIS